MKFILFYNTFINLSEVIRIEIRDVSDDENYPICRVCFSTVHNRDFLIEARATPEAIKDNLYVSLQEVKALVTEVF
jgi:hypothetical protein